MSKSIKYADFISLRDKLATDVPSRLNLSSNAQMVFGKNYCKTLEDGRKETISERFAGMCLEVAGAEMKYLPEDMSYEKRLEKVSQKAGKFIDLMVSNTFRTNTPTNINFGRLKPQYDDLGNLTGYGYKSQLGSACFVIPVDDTFGKSTEDLGDGLLEAWVAQQLIHKGGGGTGMSMCRVRPKGSVIGYDPVVDKLSSIDWELDRGVSSGPDSFFEHFYNSGTDAVKQGNTRRGANMGVQRIDHQDFLDHLYAKFGRDKARLELRMKNFNLSLALTDGFMEAAKNNEMYTLYNPQRANPKIKKILKAKHKIEDSEVVRREDISTKSQFEKILEKNSKSPLSPVTTPNMYLDKDNETVINAYSGTPIGRVHNGLVYIEAKKVLGIISELARANGEPGVVFIDRMNEYNPLLFEEEIESTNPCGEQPLLPNEACNLGSINLGKFSKYSIFDNKSEIDLGEEVIRDRFTKIEERKDGRVGVMYFDWDNLDGAIETTVEFLDNVIDENDYPSPKIEERVNQTRKIGLGYMGVHDSMISMKMRYGSEESFEFAEALAQRLHQKSLEASCKLGEERGIFPAWEQSFYNPDSDMSKWISSQPKTIPDKFRGDRELSDNVDREKRMTYGVKVRNACRTTQAPTGTTSRTCGETLEELSLDDLTISSGIEPLYGIRFDSVIMNTKIIDTSLAAINLFKREGIYSPELIEAIRKNDGSVFNYSKTPKDVAKILDTIPKDIREVLVTSSGGEGNIYEITPTQHARMSTTFQHWNDSSISKTVNLPISAQPPEIEDMIFYLWENGSKGGTVYVDKSREFQILNASNEDVSNSSNENGNNGEKFHRTLVQKAVTVETPYIGTNKEINESEIMLNPNPDSCFNTITYDSRRKKITGVFQSVAETSVEKTSLLKRANISLSARFKKGASLDQIIEETEKGGISGSRIGTLSDKGVLQMKGGNEVMKYQIAGGTTGEGLLQTLYFFRFLTEGGENFEEAFMKERMDAYLTGDISIKMIVNTQGKIKLEEGDNGGRPSILGTNKVFKLPPGMSEKNCPEC